MTRLRLAFLIAVAFGIGLPPAEAAGSYSGTGAVTGSITYGRTLPGFMQGCAPAIPITIRLSTPAFALKAPTGPQVVPLTVTASGTAGCESESLGSGMLDVVTIEAGSLRCRIGGGYTRIGPSMLFLAMDRYCAVDHNGDGITDGTANGHSWTFNLAYANRGTLAGTLVYQPY